MYSVQKENKLNFIREKQKELTPLFLIPTIGSKIRIIGSGFISEIKSDKDDFCYISGKNIIFMNNKYSFDEVEVLTDLNLTQIMALLHIHIENIMKGNKEFNAHLSYERGSVYINVLFKRKRKSKLLFKWNNLYNKTEYQSYEWICVIYDLLQVRSFEELNELFFNNKLNLKLCKNS